MWDTGSWLFRFVVHFSAFRGGGDPSVLNANYPPNKLLARGPLRGGGGGVLGGERGGGASGGGGGAPGRGGSLGGGGVGHLRTVGYATQV